MSSGLEDFSLFDLFRMEAEEQVRALQAHLLDLEGGAATAAPLESLMRASHSLKGAARIVGLDAVVHLTHAMEDRFVAAQAGQALTSSDIDLMLEATDWLAKLQAVPEGEITGWLESNATVIEACTAKLHGAPPEPAETPTTPAQPAAPAAELRAEAAPVAPPKPIPPVPAAQPHKDSPPAEDIFAQRPQDARATRERTVRMAAERFDNLVSLSAEVLVTARQLTEYGEVLERNRRLMAKAVQTVEDAESADDVRNAAQRAIEAQIAVLSAHLADLDQAVHANEHTAERLYRAALAGRLRPFSEGVTGIARLVRDTARELRKAVRLEVMGENTRIDRDILDKLEAPISHLVNNAIDHGIESPEERVAAGKLAEAHLRLYARHENGRLAVTVSDDGRGIDKERIRERVIRCRLATLETAARLSEAELLEFLFLPGFSTRETTSMISGRGVGLDVVQSMAQEAGGSVTVTSTPGAGTIFRMTLPVTRSVVRAIRVAVESELYCIPMVRIDRVACMEPQEQDGKPAAVWNERSYPIVKMASLLGLADRPMPAGEVPLLFCGGFAFAVDRFVDQAELSVKRLDPRLGKIPGVSAASVDETGNPLLILDMDDMLLSAAGAPATTSAAEVSDSLTPHILVVDDSHTVREMERRLLVRAGYTVTAAQNGQEAWNLLRLNDYDLLISDVDMPQMNGIELVTRARENPRLARIPVIILSYKDREEDRRRGLDAGADFYLTKGAFENGSFLQAVVDLIGEAAPLPSGDPT